LNLCAASLYVSPYGISLISEDLLEGNVNKNKGSSAGELRTLVNRQFDCDDFKTLDARRSC